VLGIGTGTSGTGVTGSSSNAEGTASGDGVYGYSNTGFGVHATNGQGWDPNDRNMQPATGCGIFAESDAHEGVFGASAISHGVHGVNGVGSGSTPTVGCGVWGDSQNGIGVYGETSSQAHAGVYAQNNSAFPCTAMLASSQKGHGMQGVNGAGSGKSPDRGAGVWGDSENGFGVYGASKNSNAGEFDGKVAVNGDHTVSGNAIVGGNHTVHGIVTSTDVKITGELTSSGGDCAERFDLSASAAAEAGTVMVIGEDGGLRPSDCAYDRKVAGVVSGAGAFRPGIVLDKRTDDEGRTTIALVGKVYCKVDADIASISVGDLLTTSHTPGRAMKITDHTRAFGSVIGKALMAIESGHGLIPILVSLQ
jgi:hypothetical protein